MRDPAPPPPVRAGSLERFAQGRRR
jgi:hypothetical protein